uniref:Uncharacterized protein LOC108047450 n=1 Tax=Drosophila rhopaloa TaxID=1041015 RepID=A0A6P4F707_DRORH
MMLLPSGRSNSDVYPLQNSANTTATSAGGAATGGGSGGGTGVGGGAGGATSKPKPLLLTRTSSPQLTTLPTTNGSVVHATPTRSNGFPQPQSSGIAATTGTSIATATPATSATSTGTEAPLTTTELGIGTVTGNGTGIYGPLLGQSHGGVIAGVAGNWPEIDGHLEAIQEKLKPGWSVHVGKEGRLYYCNAPTGTNNHLLADVLGWDANRLPEEVEVVRQELTATCESQVNLFVCQPMAHCVLPGRKSTLLSAGKRAKLRSRPSRVRFAESVCVNGAPLFPPSAFSLGDICVPPMANVLKVFLENGQTKSFKYDATTTVQDVVSSLLDKLCLCW